MIAIPQLHLNGIGITFYNPPYPAKRSSLICFLHLSMFLWPITKPGRGTCLLADESMLSSMVY